MPETDAQLLHDFSQNRSQLAFSRLVDRYSDLVFAAARRQIADPATAEDITQAAFLLLAQKSPSIKPAHLPAWLLTTTRLCAMRAIRTRTRRTHHEQKAAMTKPETIPPTMIPDPLLTATLDDAMSRLPSRAAAAIAMRHLQNRSVNDVAATIGVSPDAAQKILARGLARLRDILSRKGVTLPSVTVLTAAMFHESAQRAPAAMLISPNTPTTATAAIAKGASNMMLWTSIKIAITSIAATILITGATSIVASKSLIETPTNPSVSPSTPAQSKADATTTPYTASLFNSPFIQLVGCRIKQPITLKLTTQPSTPSSFSIVEQERPILQWTIDPTLAASTDTYKISIASTDDPAAAQTITADKLVTEQPIDPQINYPGDYDITITALTADSRAIASAQSHIVVKPLPGTEIKLADLQPDGSAHYTIIFQGLNATGHPMPRNASVEFTADSLEAESFVDDNGAPLRFTSRHDGRVFRYLAYINTPVQPGDAFQIAFTGTKAAAIHKLSNGDSEVSITEQPDSKNPTRCIQLFRLPPAAKLLFSSNNLTTRDIDGQTQLYSETLIPPAGATTIEFRYRLPTKTP